MTNWNRKLAKIQHYMQMNNEINHHTNKEITRITWNNYAKY